VRLRPLISVGFLILFAVVIQTTLFGRIEAITPDLVMLSSILFALTRIRPEAVLGLAFVSGLIIDLIGTSLLGLRGIVFTIVAYIAVRTRDRADIGRVVIGLWAGLLSLVGVLAILFIGTLFGQSTLLGSGTQWEVLLVPLSNTVIAMLVAPLFVRLVDGQRPSLGFV
jgi:rod shape-determining protein MreD